MADHEPWDWGVDKRLVVDLSKFRSCFETTHEFVASPNGEELAAPGIVEDDTFGVCVNGKLWEGEFEKAWHLKYTPDGRLTALIRVDDEWTVGINGEPWEQAWEFAWGTQFSADGKVICVLAKDGMEYTIAANGTPWEQSFLSCREFTVSNDGSRIAAAVQVEPLPDADIKKFLEGTWSVAVDGERWPQKFINVYAPQIAPNNKDVSVEVRVGRLEYTLAENGEPWKANFPYIWEQLYRPTGSLLAPVKMGTGWTLAENGEPIWNGRYVQLWHLRLSPDGQRVAGIVASSHGRWTIAVDDAPWRTTFSNAVLAPVFSPDGKRVAALVRDNHRWTVAADDQVWSETFDQVWDPVFSPDGSTLLAKVERDGKFAIAVNGRIGKTTFEQLWDPIFSPDGENVLIRGIEDGKYYRQIVATKDLRS